MQDLRIIFLLVIHLKNVDKFRKYKWKQSESQVIQLINLLIYITVE